MKRSSWLRRILLWTLVVLMLSTFAVQANVQAAASQPGPSQPEGWISFDNLSSPQSASLVLVNSKSTAVDLRAAIPGAWAATRSLNGVDYAVLQNDGLVTGHAQGLPDLPVLRQKVEIPFGAEYSLEVTGSQWHDVTLAELKLPVAYFPAQPSQPKCGEALPPCVPDTKIYASQSLYPAENVRVIEEYIQRGHRILLVEVWPVSYNPAEGSLRLFSDIQFRINLKGSDMALTGSQAARYASPAFADLAQSVLNFNQGAQIQSKNPPGYLIITADAYDTADLASFVALKQYQGFSVTKVKQSEITNGSTAAGIKTYIQTAYTTWPVPPSYVLLVGDTDKIPNWSFLSSGESSYKTDLYFVTMNGSSDYVPDIYRGRFPVRSTAQLANMVNNALWYDATSGAEAWVKKAAFLATDDSGNYPTAEATHNYVISTYTSPRGYTGIFPANPQAGGDKLYAITHDAETTDVLASINNNRVMVIYSGHGSQTGWAGPSVSQTNVRNLTGVLSAYVAGHACVTADFNTAEAFSDTWVIQPNKGALVYVGASNNSYWDEDDVLERVTFDTLYDPDVLEAPSINAMLYAGLAAVHSEYPGSAQYYWEEYNLFGDPAAAIVLGPKLPDFTLAANPTSVNICDVGSEETSIQVGSINEYVTPVDLSLTDVPTGATFDFVPAAVTPPGSSALTLTSDGSLAAGSYPFTVQGISGALSHSTDLTLNIFDAVPLTPTPLTPADGASNQSTTLTFTWQAVDQAQSYLLQVARDATFTNLIVNQSGIMDTSYTLTTELLTSTHYYWRVQTGNPCGVTDFSPIFDFTTLPAPGDCAVGYSPVVLHQVDFESGAGSWTDASTGSYHWALSTAQSHSPSHAQLAADASAKADQRLVSPAIALPAAGEEPLTFTYWNRYEFEGSTTSCYDGGILEISTNGGSTWVQVPTARLLTQPYNGTVSSSYENPLAGLNAWCSDNTTWTRSVVDLNSYAGQTVQFRFRLGSDRNVGDTGWFIDDALVKSCQLDVPQYGLTLTAAQTEASALPGRSVDYILTLVNTGSTTDTFTFSATGNLWDVSLPADAILAEGDTTQVTVRVTLPAEAVGSDVVTITATSAADPTKTAAVLLATTAYRVIFMPVLVK